MTFASQLHDIVYQAVRHVWGSGDIKEKEDEQNQQQPVQVQQQRPVEQEQVNQKQKDKTSFCSTTTIDNCQNHNDTNNRNNNNDDMILKKMIQSSISIWFQHSQQQQQQQQEENDDEHEADENTKNQNDKNQKQKRITSSTRTKKQQSMNGGCCGGSWGKEFYDIEIRIAPALFNKYKTRRKKKRKKQKYTPHHQENQGQLGGKRKDKKKKNSNNNKTQQQQQQQGGMCRGNKMEEEDIENVNDNIDDDENDTDVLVIRSPFGVERQVHSAVELGQLLLPYIEDSIIRKTTGSRNQDHKKTTTMEKDTKNHNPLSSKLILSNHIRLSDPSGFICICSIPFYDMLLQNEKQYIPCPYCIQWFPSLQVQVQQENVNYMNNNNHNNIISSTTSNKKTLSQGLWWHIQQKHSMNYAVAIATTQKQQQQQQTMFGTTTDCQAIVVYNSNQNNEINERKLKECIPVLLSSSSLLTGRSTTTTTMNHIDPLFQLVKLGDYMKLKIQLQDCYKEYYDNIMQDAITTTGNNNNHNNNNSRSSMDHDTTDIRRSQRCHFINHIVIDSFGSSLLLWASGNGSLQIVQYLIETWDANPYYTQGCQTTTTTTTAASPRGTSSSSSSSSTNVTTTTTPSNNNKNNNSKSNKNHQQRRAFHGRTALHWASRNGHLHVVQYLVGTFYDVSLDNNNATAASTNPNDDVNKKKNPKDLSSHHKDDRSNSCSMRTMIDASTADGTTAFHLAAYQHDLSIMRFLYKNGCQVQKINQFGCNAALWVAQGITTYNRMSTTTTTTTITHASDTIRKDCSGYSIMDKCNKQLNHHDEDFLTTTAPSRVESDQQQQPEQLEDDHPVVVIRILIWLESVGCSIDVVNHSGHGIVHKAAQRKQYEVCHWYITNRIMKQIKEMQKKIKHLQQQQYEHIERKKQQQSTIRIKNPLDHSSCSIIPKLDPGMGVVVTEQEMKEFIHTILAAIGPDHDGCSPSDLAGMEQQQQQPHDHSSSTMELAHYLLQQEVDIVTNIFHLLFDYCIQYTTVTMTTTIPESILDPSIVTTTTTTKTYHQNDHDDINTGSTLHTSVDDNKSTSWQQTIQPEQEMSIILKRMIMNFFPTWLQSEMLPAKNYDEYMQFVPWAGVNRMRSTITILKKKKMKNQI